MSVRPPLAAADAIRQEVGYALDALDALAGAAPSAAEFYDAALERLTAVTGADGAAIWLCTPRGERHAFRRRGEEHGLSDGSLAADFEVAGAPRGVLTLHFAREPASAARPGLMRFLEAVADRAARFQAADDLKAANDPRDAATQLHRLTLAVHQPWSRSEVLASVAAEGRRLLNCDRVAVAVARGGGVRLEAVSGAATLNRRSGELKRLEQLAAAVHRWGEPLFYDEADPDQLESHSQRPPQIADALEAYLDESAARQLAFVPLRENAEASQSRPAAGMIAENRAKRDGGGEHGSAAPNLWLLADHAGVAIGRATRLARLPIVGPMLGARSLRHALTRRWLPRAAAVAIGLASVVAALLLVRVDYSIRVTGELTPLVQQHVFAPSDGVVLELHAEHGQPVAAGDSLLALRSPDLELERTRIRGELATAAQELAAAQAARLEILAGATGGRTPGELAAERLRAEQRIEALRAELGLLDEQADRLRVVSPIDGSVVTWGAEQTLAARPVRRGQRLLTVADLKSGWRVRLEAPDRHAAAILDQQQQSGSGVDVRLVTADRPDVVRRVTADRFRLATERDAATGESRLAMEATLPADPAAGFRPGAQVVGRVECGRRSLAYAWLGDVYHELRRWLF
ncbi:MAG: efflux RND transporter periplasmic adaptor subunit [Planctomycetota bacterium]